MRFLLWRINAIVLLTGSIAAAGILVPSAVQGAIGDDPRIQPRKPPRPPQLSRASAAVPEYPAGKYRTMVVVYEGVVAVMPYDDGGRYEDRQVIVNAGQRAEQVRTIL